MTNPSAPKEAETVRCRGCGRVLMPRPDHNAIRALWICGSWTCDQGDRAQKQMWMTEYLATGARPPMTTKEAEGLDDARCIRLVHDAAAKYAHDLPADAPAKRMILYAVDRCAALRAVPDTNPAGYQEVERVVAEECGLDGISFAKITAAVRGVLAGPSGRSLAESCFECGAPPGNSCNTRVAHRGRAVPDSQKGKRAADVGDAWARKVAADVVQRIADSEPDIQTVEAQEVLAPTEYAHMFVLNGEVIEKAIHDQLSDALFDGEIMLATPRVPDSQNETEGAAVEGLDLEEAMDEYQSACFDYLNTSVFSDKTPARLRIQAARESIRVAALRRSPLPVRDPNETGGVCPTHGLAVLMTHVNNGEPCTDYLRAHIPPVRDEVATGERERLAGILETLADANTMRHPVRNSLRRAARLLLLDALTSDSAPPGATPRAETEKETT